MTRKRFRKWVLRVSVAVVLLGALTAGAWAILGDYVLEDHYIVDLDSPRLLDRFSAEVFATTSWRKRDEFSSTGSESARYSGST